jgi:hypothetical protein
MNSILNECIYLKAKQIKIPAWGSNHALPNHTRSTTPPPSCLSENFLPYLYYLYYMILMSEKMMSQAITNEFIYIFV